MNLRQIFVFHARLAGFVLLIECVTLWGWSRWFWTTIQAHYMGAYVWSSAPGISPEAGLKVRWIWKTAPGGKHELAIEDDAVRVLATANDEAGMALSRSARDAGWTTSGRGSSGADSNRTAALNPFRPGLRGAKRLDICSPAGNDWTCPCDLLAPMPRLAAGSAAGNAVAAATISLGSPASEPLRKMCSIGSENPSRRCSPAAGGYPGHRIAFRCPSDKPP